MAIAQKIRALDFFLLEVVTETVTKYWREKIDASDAKARGMGRGALRIIDENLIDRTSAYADSVLTRMDVSKNKTLVVIEAEDPTKKFTALEGLFRLLLNTAQGKAGNYNVTWYVGRVFSMVEGNPLYNVLTGSNVEREKIEALENYTKVTITMLDYYRRNVRSWVQQGASMAEHAIDDAGTKPSASTVKSVCGTCNKKSHVTADCRQQGGAKAVWCKHCSMWGHSDSDCGASKKKGNVNGKRKQREPKQPDTCARARGYRPSPTYMAQTILYSILKTSSDIKKNITKHYIDVLTMNTDEYLATRPLQYAAVCEGLCCGDEPNRFEARQRRQWRQASVYSSRLQKRIYASYLSLLRQVPPRKASRGTSAPRRSR